MQIGELARRAGTTTRALRYYEARGLLPSRRTANGYRAYDEEHLRLLQQIRLLQDFGFELEETRPFVECLRAGHPHGDSCPASIEVYRSKLAELDTMIGQLTGVRDQIAGQLAQAEAAREEVAASATDAPEPRCELVTPLQEDRA
ncbi:MerR family transcriptional regulator [Streptomyces sp. A7024]|uniref:MerR family transcriptional regulator n=1 Tax=Streptomyces coryli TaxID=1128680 RepID=A0A6G4UDN0_9ACTN|nr:MerR family transcriptional regulator [Streptomyces coryli]NGN69488.1 MerR family transcriptional regulator [Streptomyces coryli]